MNCCETLWALGSTMESPFQQKWCQRTNWQTKKLYQSQGRRVQRLNNISWLGTSTLHSKDQCQTPIIHVFLWIRILDIWETSVYPCIIWVTEHQMLVILNNTRRHLCDNCVLCKSRYHWNMNYEYLYCFPWEKCPGKQARDTQEKSRGMRKPMTHPESNTFCKWVSLIESSWIVVSF